MVRLAGFEPAAICLEGRCSIHLSYRRTPGKYSKLPVRFASHEAIVSSH